MHEYTCLGGMYFCMICKRRLLSFVRWKLHTHRNLIVCPNHGGMQRVSSVTNKKFDATEDCVFADVAERIRFRMRVADRILLDFFLFA